MDPDTYLYKIMAESSKQVTDVERIGARHAHHKHHAHHGHRDHHNDEQEQQEGLDRAEDSGLSAEGSGLQREGSSEQAGAGKGGQLGKQVQIMRTEAVDAAEGGGSRSLASMLSQFAREEQELNHLHESAHKAARHGKLRQVRPRTAKEVGPDGWA